MAQATRTERQEVKELGASVPLYRRARRAGATHDEVISALRGGGSFFQYEVLRTAGASHAEALALESEGVDAIAYRDLRHIGIGDDDLEDARRRGVTLDAYFQARKAGLAHDDATALVGAGFRHANVRAWKTAARARELLAARSHVTRENLVLLVRRAQGFKGDPEDLVKQITTGEAAQSRRAA